MRGEDEEQQRDGGEVVRVEGGRVGGAGVHASVRDTAGEAHGQGLGGAGGRGVEQRGGGGGGGGGAASEAAEADGLVEEEEGGRGEEEEQGEVGGGGGGGRRREGRHRGGFGSVG